MAPIHTHTELRFALITFSVSRKGTNALHDRHSARAMCNYKIYETHARARVVLLKIIKRSSPNFPQRLTRVGFAIMFLSLSLAFGRHRYIVSVYMYRLTVALAH